MGVEYNNYSSPNIKECRISSAIDYNETDISNLITLNDENYYEMPATGDYFDLEFEAPKTFEGMSRTIFAKTSGYYKIHLPKSNQPDYQFIYSLGMNSGKIVKYSIKKYIEWFNQNLSTIK